MTFDSIHRSGSFALVAAVAVAASLSGCTPSSSDAASGELTSADSPLAVYLDAAWGGDLSPEEVEKEQATDAARAEELIARCMTDEGFEYTPVGPEATEAVVVDANEDWDIDDRAWVEKYGYGIFEFPGSEIEPSADPEDDTSSIARNVEYIESLSESEVAAYDEAMYGPPVDDEALEDPDYEYEWEESGCAGRAQHEVHGDDPLSTSEFDDLFERIATMSDGLVDSPEHQALDAEWAACMDEAGESGFTRQTDAQESIYAAMPVEEEAPEGSETEEPDDKSIPDTPETRALHERELALALIDLTCREEIDYRQSSLKIQFAREEQFIDDNRAELDAFKLAAEQAH